MGLISKIFGRFTGSTAPSNTQPRIKVFDGHGQELEIERNVYREKVLPVQFEEAGNDPEKLYSAIVLALGDEFFAEAVAPARRFLGIDQGSERATVVLGIALMRSGRLDEAQQIFELYIDEQGESGAVLTNLAKVYASRGEEDRAESTLWRSLNVDPNQENGLEWWGALHGERGGSSAFLNAMIQAASIAGSYRPQLWIAKAYLEAGRTEEALGMYREILPLLADDGNALMMLTGDLGSHGRIQEGVLMVRPFYDPERHGPLAGINLVYGLIDMERYREAHELLDELDKLGRPDLMITLAELRASIPEGLARST